MSSDFGNDWAPALLELLAKRFFKADSNQDGFDYLLQTLSWLNGLLQTAQVAGSEDFRAGWRRAVELIGDANTLATEFAGIASGEELDSERKLHEALKTWVTNLNGLPVGKAILVPLVWPEDNEDARRHAALGVIYRDSDKDGTLYIVNPIGSGSDYHLRQLGGVPTRPRPYVLPARAGPVSWDRLCSAPFWLFVFRPLLNRKEDCDPLPAQLYEALLPFLAERPRKEQLAAHLGQNGGGDDWLELPESDTTKVHLVLGTLLLALRLSFPTGDDRSSWVVLQMQWEGLKEAIVRAGLAGEQARAQRHLVQDACCCLARKGSFQTVAKEWQAKILELMHDWLDGQLNEVAKIESAWQLPPEAPKTWRTKDAELSFQGFRRLSDQMDVTPFMGSLERPEVVLPVLLVQDKACVTNYHEAVIAVQRCSHSCTMLVNQRHLMPAADFYLVALVQNLFTCVLPVPQQHESCFWRRLPMHHETQRVLVSELGQLVRQFTACALSLPRTPHLHGVRLLTVAAALAIIDAVIRQIPAGVASHLSHVFTGKLTVKASCLPFELAPLPLAAATEEILITDPQLAMLRTGLLDYFQSRSDSCRVDRSIFAFEGMCLGSGDIEFLHRLALLRGFKRSSQPDTAHLSFCLAGKVTQFLSTYPGLAVLRDTTFLLRLLCSKDQLPERKPGQLLQASDVELNWQFDHRENQFRVVAFGGKELRLGSKMTGAASETSEGASTGGFFGFFKKAVSTFTSGGDSMDVLSSSLASPARVAGQDVATEEDVLHLADLPSFCSRFTPAQSEHLLTLLTVPYLRTPLVLRFFNDRAQFGALACSDLQVVLDAILFEPGPFLQESANVAATHDVTEYLVPCIPEGALRTPAGRLCHELSHSPNSVAPELDGFFRLAVEMDSPSYSPEAASVLYAVRLWSRVAAFTAEVARCSCLRKVQSWLEVARCSCLEGMMFWIRQKGDDNPLPVVIESINDSRIVARLLNESPSSRIMLDKDHEMFSRTPRGFNEASIDSVMTLTQHARKWRDRLCIEAVPTLERWCSRAMEERETDTAIALWLHLALIYRWSPSLNCQGVSTLICAEVYLHTNLDLNEENVQARKELLGFADTEIFDLFQSTRTRVYHWLRDRESERSQVLEHVIKVIVSSQMALTGDEAAVLGRKWMEMQNTWDGLGRFAPSKPAEPDNALADEDFAQWLAASVDTAPVELNINMGQLQFRQHSLAVIPRNVASSSQFREIFPSLSDTGNCDIVASAGSGNAVSGLVWAKVESRPNMEKYRLVGTRFEAILWKAWDRQPEYKSFLRSFPSEAEKEGWVVKALDTVQELKALWSGPAAASWFALEESSMSHVVKLIAKVPGVEGAPPTLKEVEIFKEPPTIHEQPVIHLYDVVEYGRHCLRKQVFTSDTCWTYCVPGKAIALQPPAITVDTSVSKNSAGAVNQVYSPQESLQILREDAYGTSSLVPREFLEGSLPDCLLDAFEFWRASEPEHAGRIVGKMRAHTRARAAVPQALIISLLKSDGQAPDSPTTTALKESSLAPFMDLDKQAHVQRITFSAKDEAEEESQIRGCLHDEWAELMHAQTETLVDLLSADRKSRGSWDVARWALQLEDLSHVLAWTKRRRLDGLSGGEWFIDLIEFPRLGLSFTSSPGKDGELQCDQHRGLKVTLGSTLDKNTLRILRPFPRCVLLQDAFDELFALVAVADHPKRNLANGYDVKLVRNDYTWLASLESVHRHQLYSVHASREFLTASTLAAELYLLLLRILQGFWTDACESVVTCMAFGLPSEQDECLIWEEIVSVLGKDRCSDAVVVRLKLMIVLHHHGQVPPEGWDPESDLVAWTSHGLDCKVGRLLTPTEEASLLDLCSHSTSWELHSRSELLSKLLRLHAERGRCCDGGTPAIGKIVSVPRLNRSSQAAKSRSTIDTFEDNRFLEVDTMNAEKNFNILKPEDIALYSEGSGPSGIAAVSWVLNHTPIKLGRDFLFLYELVTGTRKAMLTFSEDPKWFVELIYSMIPESQLSEKPRQAGLLKALKANPELARKFPKFKGDHEEFEKQIVDAIFEHRLDLQVEPRKTTNGYGGLDLDLACDSTAWTFKFDERSNWEQSSSSGGSIISGDSGVRRRSSKIDVGAKDNPLTNTALISLVTTLKRLRDRRLPSTVWDFDCKRRSLDDTLTCRTTPLEASDLESRIEGLPIRDIPTLISRPLHPVSEKHGSLVTLGPSSLKKDTDVFEVLTKDLCPIMKTQAGSELIRRMQDDVAKSSAMEPQFQHITMSSVSAILEDRAEIAKRIDQIKQLLVEMEGLLEKDRESMMEAIRKATDLANSVDEPPNVSGPLSPSSPESGRCHRFVAAAHRLGQLGGSEAVLRFQDMLRLLLARSGLEVMLSHLNPLMEDKNREDMCTASVLVMLLSTRSIACRRCILHLRRLLDLLQEALPQSREMQTQEKSKKGIMSALTSTMTGAIRNVTGGMAEARVRSNSNAMFIEQFPAKTSSTACEIVEASEQVAREIATEQHCMTNGNFDPRLLCFEFISRIVLRQKQVHLVRDMMSAIEGRKPLVHQMIMGGGKTTVVAPLVVLMGATAERACVVCCPAPLLHFTVRVLRERLCAALARPVIIFNFMRVTEVTEELYVQLLHAQDGRAALCTTPTALKSTMLRLLLTVHDMDTLQIQKRNRSGERKSIIGKIGSLFQGSDDKMQAAEARLKCLEHDARVLRLVLGIFRSGVLLLDDIDLLMHPLRSELHWPLGEQHALDFTAAPGSRVVRSLEMQETSAFNMSSLANSPAGIRWQAAFHLLDGFFSCQVSEGPSVALFSGRPEADSVLQRLKAEVKEGLLAKHIQAFPHLTLLSVEFYHSRLKKTLAEWMLLWLRRLRPFAVSDQVVIEYLIGVKESPDLKGLGDHLIKAMNLSRVWLQVLLPHLASRIHRVHYGLLSETTAAWQHEPPARRCFAVPFVGKDAPSDSSQFSHPDVVIGFTWLAFRFDGLRSGDFKTAMARLGRWQRREANVAPQLRRAARLYSAWVQASGGRVRGDRVEIDNMSAKGAVSLALDSVKRPEALREFTDGVVPPLKWLDIQDDTQIATLYAVLVKSPFLMEYYLHEEILPEYLRHTDSKLSASGQDLGSDVLFGSRLGFSGTPNDLLPLAMGSCQYASGDNARILHTLTDPSMVAVTVIQEESQTSHKLLQRVANDSRHRPPLNALIDVGALITGMTNVEVAQYLLDSGLLQDAVVFCDQGGEQLVLRRGFSEPVDIASFTLPPERRFVFYDQVHTTGIDISHSPGARAALTLGKDSTFRDYAQGAYRMRGIGRGQKIEIYVTPEVRARINVEVQTEIQRAHVPQDFSPQPRSSSPGLELECQQTKEISLLDRVCAWLLIQQAHSEYNQANLLKTQSIANEGRRCAYQLLWDHVAQEGKYDSESENLEEALDLFREQIDFSVDENVYESGAKQAADPTLQALIKRVQPFLDERGQMNVDRFVREVSAANLADSEAGLFAEQEKEQEEEREMEEERQEEAEADGDPPIMWQKLPRDESMKPWRIDMLASAPDDKSDFYAASQLEFPAYGSNAKELSIAYPEALWVSKHFHRPSSTRGRGSLRRLKTPQVVLEWIPDAKVLRQMHDSSEEVDAVSPKVKSAVEIMSIATTGSFTIEEAAQLFAILRIPVERKQSEDFATEVNKLVSALKGGLAKRFQERSASSDDWSQVITQALRNLHALRVQPGRYFLLLSLAEAEAVRVALHLRAGQPFLPSHPDCRVALRAIQREPAGLSLLDCSHGWEEARFRWHEIAAAHCLTFIGGETQFSSSELDLLRLSLQQSLWHKSEITNSEGWKAFFDASYAVRRKPQRIDLAATPISRLFVSKEEHWKRYRQAVLRETYAHLLDIGTAPEPAFNAMDLDGDGHISPADLGANMQVGLNLPSLLVFRLFEVIDRQARGVISAEQWYDALMEDDITGRRATGDNLVDSSSGCLKPPDEEKVPLDVLRRMTVEVVRHTAYKELWNSEGSMCRKNASVWAATQLTSGLVRLTNLRLELGHYANQGLYDVRGGGSGGVEERRIISIRDKRYFGGSSEDYLTAVADHYFPFPVGFREIWNQQRGSHLHVWRPIPPSDDFVALGMIVTSTPEEPSLSSMRCVAKSFCRPARKNPALLWDNGGAGGKQGSMWMVNSLQLLWMVAGDNKKPEEKFWELADDAITFDYSGRPSVNVIHERSS